MPACIQERRRSRCTPAGFVVSELDSATHISQKKSRPVLSCLCAVWLRREVCRLVLEFACSRKVEFLRGRCATARRRCGSLLASSNVGFQ